MSEPKGRILVLGATGLVGRACMEHYRLLNYPVTAISRAEPVNTYGASWVSLDLTDRDACFTHLSPLPDIIQIVYAALHEEPNLLAGWTSQAHVDRNGAMFKNCLDAVLDGESGKNGILRNVTILQGGKAYGAHVHPIRTSAREDRDEDRSIPNFYWAQEDYLKELWSSQPSPHPQSQHWTYNILRPALIIGMCSSGAMNLIAVLGVYASIMRSRGEKTLKFPGTGMGIGEATDTRIIARCCEWCLQNREKKDVGNQIFNLTNGEMSCLYEDWPSIASLFGLEPSYPSASPSSPPDTPFSLRTDLPTYSADWDALRTKHKLKAPNLDKFLSQSTQFADHAVAPRKKMPSSMSCVKVRRAGFADMVYSDEMYGYWFEKYREEGLLPRF